MKTENLTLTTLSPYRQQKREAMMARILETAREIMREEGVAALSMQELARRKGIWLVEDAARPDSSHDFGKDIIPRMLQLGMRVFAYPYGGYWVDVGTVDSYWQAHMDLLIHPPRLDLSDRSWVIHTKSEERPPVLIQKGAMVEDCLITDGSVIAPGARVERSVLSPGVYVGPEAVVQDSILFTDCSVEAGARVERAIIDKGGPVLLYLWSKLARFHRPVC